HVAGESIPAGSSRTNRSTRLHASADALLVVFEQRVPSFSLRQRCPLHLLSSLFSFPTCHSRSRDKSFSIFSGTCFYWKPVSYRSFLRRGGCCQENFRCGRDRRSRVQRRFHTRVCFC